MGVTGSDLAAQLRPPKANPLLRLGVVTALGLTLSPPTITVDDRLMRLLPSAGVLAVGDTVVWADQGATPFVLGKLSNGPQVMGPIAIGSVGAPAYQNSWGYAGAGYEDLHYWKDADGVVHLKGLTFGGTRGNAITTLPVGIRPLAAHRSIDTASLTVYGICNINADGTVIPDASGGLASYCLVDTSWYVGP